MNGHSEGLGSQRGSFEAIPTEIPIELAGSPMKQQKRARASKAPFVSLVLIASALGLIYLQQSAFLNAVRLSGASLLAQADPILRSKLQAIAEAGQYIKCSATGLQSKSMDDFAPSKKVLGKLDHLPSTPGKIKGNKFVELLIQDAPCWGVSSCCQTNTYIRPNKKEDIKAFNSLYEDHDLSLLYAIFQEHTPQYILEAGAGAGFTSQLFKLLWPRAVVVSLESDAANFEAMVMNTRETDGVHAVHGGLWPYQATLRQRSKKGSFLLQESAAGRSFGKHDGILGLSVNNLLGMFDIPAFDFVYLDMEGSEAVVFSGAADLRWLSSAKVIAMKMHDALGKYFGIEKELVQHVSGAFAGRNFHVVADDVHVILISGEMMKKIPGLVVAQQQGEMDENGIGGEEADEESFAEKKGNETDEEVEK
ncbi:hypothetical protein Ndes2526B_g00566 [Nannochloris sp. 'desiccata']|nr:hypothetical protein NADE_003727 [Chlorella desiccata (nom. nud.)]